MEAFCKGLVPVQLEMEKAFSQTKEEDFASLSGLTPTAISVWTGTP